MHYKLDESRRLFIKKDILEVNQWLDDIENINNEISKIQTIVKQIITDKNLSQTIQNYRRKNTLIMGAICQYEQELRKEIEYGTTEYNVQRAKVHESKRMLYVNNKNTFRKLKDFIYSQLLTFKRN